MNKKQQQNLLYILIPSTILVIAWIIFSVYNRAVMTTISKSQETAIQAISPTFPTGVLSDLKKRSSVTPLFSVDSVPNTEASGEATLSLTPTPTLPPDQSASTPGELQPEP